MKYTKEQIEIVKKRLEIMQAYVNGQIIEVKTSESNWWVEVNIEPTWNWDLFDFRLKEKNNGNDCV